MTDDLKFLPPELVKAWELCEKANAQLPLSDTHESGLYDCPLCGEGTISAEDVKTFDTRVASGVQIFGVGESLTTLEAFVKGCFEWLPLALSLVIKMAKEREEIKEFCIKRDALIAKLAPEPAPSAGPLLRDKAPAVCYCPVDKYMAPVIMGRQMACLRRCCENGTFGQLHECRKQRDPAPSKDSHNG